MWCLSSVWSQFKFNGVDEPLYLGFTSDSATYNHVGRNIDSFAFMNQYMNTKEKLILHPINIFEGADTKENSIITLYDQKILLRQLNGFIFEVCV